MNDANRHQHSKPFLTVHVDPENIFDDEAVVDPTELERLSRAKKYPQPNIPEALDDENLGSPN